MDPRRYMLGLADRLCAMAAGAPPRRRALLLEDAGDVLLAAASLGGRIYTVIACIDCPARATCAVCDRCEAHCQTGGSGRCAAAHDALGIEKWRAGRRAAMAELADVNRLRPCSCGGLEDPDRPHQHRVP